MFLRTLAVWLLLAVSAIASTPASVCRVYAPSGGAGTGWLVEEEGRQWVVTNHHVVEQGRGGPPHRTCLVRFPSAGRQYTLRVVSTWKSNDVAVMEASQVEGLTPFTLGDDLPQGDAEVYGFGGGQFGAMESSFRAVDSTPGWDRYKLAGVVRSGDSGSPVIVRGRVIGIVFGNELDESGRYEVLGLATRVGPIRRTIRHAARAVGAAGRGVVNVVTGGCQGGVCPSPRYGSPIRMRPIQQPGPQVIINAPPAKPVTPVPREPQSPCDCEEWQAEVEQRLAALGKGQSDITSKLSKLADASTKIVANVSANTTQITALATAPGVDLSGVDARLAEIERRLGRSEGDSQRLADLEGRLGDWSPPAPSATYYALVADRQAEYWHRLRDEYARAAEAYQGIRLAPPPPNGAGRLPRLVAFRDGTPIGDIGGSREVSEALLAISRGKRPATL